MLTYTFGYPHTHPVLSKMQYLEKLKYYILWLVPVALHPCDGRGQSPRQTWVSPSPLFSLALVAWEAYSDWVISPLPWVPLCGTVYVFQSLYSVPTPWLEFVHASVHEAWVPVCCIVCMFQSVYFWSQTLFRMCTCISTCFYVHPTVHVNSTPMDSYMETRVALCGSVCVSQSPCFWSYTLVRMSTCISA